MSAIDWLSNSLTQPPAPEPVAAVPNSSVPAPVTVERLGPIQTETPGLVTGGNLGLTHDLWGNSTARDVALRMATVPGDLPPSLRDLEKRILIARLGAPKGGDDDLWLLRARVDTLLEMGALDEARLLLADAGPETTRLFRRWFDIALLTGDENDACRTMVGTPSLSPTYPARIFCLARNGDWDNAALTLGTAESLGILSDEENMLLSRFLDPDMFSEIPPPPERVTPLSFRLFEAAGAPLPTAGLPLAFARADTGPNSGWKARIEATERLVRSGALPAATLFAVYAERDPAASGGVWDRVGAVQALNAALLAGTGINAALTPAWEEMKAAGLAPAFAWAYAAALGGEACAGCDAGIVFDLALLAPGPYRPPATGLPGRPDAAFLEALGRGDPGAAPTEGPMQAAVSQGFTLPKAGGQLRSIADDGRPGEALLLALTFAGEAYSGDPDRLAEALAYLRETGQEDLARRAAIEILLLGAPR